MTLINCRCRCDPKSPPPEPVCNRGEAEGLHTDFKASSFSTLVAGLSQEILIMIFEYLHHGRCRPFRRCNQSSDNKGDKDAWSMISVLLVSRAWRVVAETFLYRCIRIDPHSVHHDAEERRLFAKMVQTLRRRPVLCSYVKHLEIHRPSYLGIKDLAPIRQLLDNMSLSVKKLEIFDHVNSEIGNQFSSCISSMPLEELILRGMVSKLFFKGLPQHINHARLRKITLADFYHGNHDDVSIPLHSSLPVGLHVPFSGHVKELELAYYDVDVGLIHSLLTWPSALETFTLILTNPDHGATHWRSYGAGRIQNLLDLQSHSLRKIVLPILFHENRLPNFAEVSNLRELHLSHTTLFDCSPHVACQRIVAPLLEYLVVHTDLHDQQCSVHRVFDQQCTDWFVGFAQHRTQNLTENKLRGIHIVYPIYSPDCWEAPNDDEPSKHPYAYLNQAKSALAIFNIELTWTQPVCSEEEWEKNHGEQACSDITGELASPDSSMEASERYDDLRSGCVDHLEKDIHTGFTVCDKSDIYQSRICNWLQPRKSASTELCCT